MEDKEEVEGTVIGYIGEYVSIVPVVYPRGTVSVSSLGYFSSVGSFSKPSRSSLPLSIRVHHIKGGFKNKNMRRKKNINSQQERTRCEERRKQMRVAV